MISSDLSTMGLCDVLQWVDGTRVSGVLTIQRPSGAVWIQLSERQVVSCVRPEARGVVLDHLTGAIDRARLELDATALAFEMLCDQFLDANDSFRFEPGAVPAEPGVMLDLAVQELVMTGMQYVDEWTEVRDLYPSGSARMRRVEGPEPRELTKPQLALLALAEHETALHDARLCLGLSQPAMLRNVDVLRKIGCVHVDGTPEGADLTEQLVRKTMQLVRQKQFDEASHVFGALLSSEPGSNRIRELLRMVEREHVADLYLTVPARALVRRRSRLRALEPRLSRGDREVVELINDRWDVASLVLASPLREVETLKALRKLHRMEGIELLLPRESIPAAEARR
jgi:hypothetical protein